ncbi:MAG: SCP2 sterol-binding domain-containing protein [Thermoplasmatota archaeon]
MVYLTEPWAEAALAVVEGDPGIAEAVKGVKLSILTIITGAPEGRYGFFYAAFDDGLSDYRVGYDYDVVTAGVGEPTFAISGPYEVFAAIQRGELGERKALLTGKLHLTGSLLKALRHMHAMEAISSALARIDCAT